MEIETITLEQWMCRICLNKGSHNIFEKQLTAPSQGQQQRKHTANDSISIVDALNHFSEFKISQSEIINEPIMLCESCCADLFQCYQFRTKLNEAECLLRKDTVSHCLQQEDQEEESKTGLTLHLADIEPFLEEEIKEEIELKSDTGPVKQAKIHHAKPRFQLTSQVSNILRHVATSSTAVSYGEKRKEIEELPDSATPKKIQRRYSTDKQLEKTLIVPNYIFTCEMDEDTQERNVLLVERSVVSETSHIPSETDVDRTDSDDIFYCKHCPKAFSTPYHLLTHTKNVHLCQHCLRYLPNALARNAHIREEHKSLRCSLCSFRSQYATNLRAHLRNTHSVTLPAHVSILQQTQESNGNK